MDLFATPELSAFYLAITFIFGLILGSFLNCWAWRLTHGEVVWHGRSHCINCGHPLSPADLVPLASWICLRGRCRYCRQPISMRYPACELIMAAVLVSILLRYGLSLRGAELMLIACVLLVLSLTDLDSWLIPNGCIITLLVVHVVYLAVRTLLHGTDVFAFLSALGNAALGGIVLFVPIGILVLFMDHLLQRPSMGGGDLKLFFCCGCIFGFGSGAWGESVLLVIASCIIGIVLAAIGNAYHTKTTASTALAAHTHTDGKKADAATANATNVATAYTDAMDADTVDANALSLGAADITSSTASTNTMDTADLTAITGADRSACLDKETKCPDAIKVEDTQNLTATADLGKEASEAHVMDTAERADASCGASCGASTTQQSTETSVSDMPHGTIAFGPSIALAFWLTIIFGPNIIGWYLSLMI